MELAYQGYNFNSRSGSLETNNLARILKTKRYRRRQQSNGKVLSIKSCLVFGLNCLVEVQIPTNGAYTWCTFYRQQWSHHGATCEYLLPSLPIHGPSSSFIWGPFVRVVMRENIQQPLSHHLYFEKSIMPMLSVCVDPRSIWRWKQ